ncbi:MAG TPA: DUF3613 domain-containing protein [Thiopseudomonas sp.]|nr:DUF3613 domain-containing protein [Thiopseudomonas sp.]
MNIKLVFSVVLFSLVSSQVAAKPDQRGLIDSPELQTELWLKLQREGTLKSEYAQTATPTERELAMQRLLESYKYPIPEYFDEADGGEFER